MPFPLSPVDDAPIFLHAGWRSRGTWLWGGLRDTERAIGFHEPLHERLATLTAAAIADGEAGPYWREYAALLRRDAPGVPGFPAALTFGHAFAGADVALPELAAYLRGLLTHASRTGRVPVLKFCRSLGRIGWMRAAFPEAMHIALLRRPDAQWASARRQRDEHGNPYFMAMPLVTLACNRGTHAVETICRSLRVPLPRLRPEDATQAVRAGERMLERLSPGEAYRCFLAWWLAGTLDALATDAHVVDADMLVWSAACRTELAAAIACQTSLRLDLAVDRAAAAARVPPLTPEEAALQREALDLLQERRGTLPPENYLLAWSLLAAALVRPAAGPRDRSEPLPPAPARIRSAWAWRPGLLAG